MLHGAEAPHSRLGGGAGSLDRDFLIHGILHIDPGFRRQLIEAVHDFRRRGPGIGSHKAHVSFERPADNRLVT